MLSSVAACKHMGHGPAYKLSSKLNTFKELILLAYYSTPNSHLSTQPKLGSNLLVAQNIALFRLKPKNPENIKVFCASGDGR